MVKDSVVKDPIVLTWTNEIQGQGSVSLWINFPGEDSLQICSG